MATLLVQAHPLEESYNAAIRRRVLEALEQANEDVVSCRLGQGERPSVDEMIEADALVLVYPTWSGGLPAMLLDWTHDVLDQPRAMHKVTALSAVTTCGSSRFVNRVQGEWGRKYLKTSLLPRCAPGASFRWLPLYKIDRLGDVETGSHLESLGRSFG